MKAYPALVSTAVIGLAVCSQEAAKPAEASVTSTASEAASAETTASADAAPISEVAPTGATAAPAAGNYAIIVETNDAMQFNTGEIQVNKAYKEPTTTLEHIDTQPKESMGHNIVVGKAEDVDGIFKSGAGAATTDYVKPDSVRVVTRTKLVSGGEEASLTLDPVKLVSGRYKSTCTFPGHSALMNSKVTLVG